MRVLVTGGAGFIGTHVVAALRAAGHEVVVARLPAPGRPPRPAHARRRRSSSATSATRRRGRRGLRGVDAVVHQAAMVGLGVDLDDLPEYVSCNDLGTAVLLAAMARARVRRLVLASSMVVYGEGAYSCPDHGPARPAPRRRRPTWRPAGSSRAARPAASRCAPDLVDEDAPLDPRSVYAATKLAQEHLAGGLGPRDRRERGRAALPQRLRPGHAPRHPVRRGRRDLPVQPGAGRAAAGVRGRRPAARLRPRERRGPGQRRGPGRADVAGDAGRGLLRAYNVASGEPAHGRRDGDGADRRARPARPRW